VSVRLGIECILVRREWQVQGSFEARALTRQLCRAFPNFGASNTIAIVLARVRKSTSFRSCLFFFSTSERNDYYCYHILCCHYYEVSKWELLFCQFSIRRLDHSLLLLQSNSFLNRTTRMYNVLEAQPFRIDWARSGVDEHIIQNTSERTSTERCHHRDPISN
jgi:hypothetical protein